MSKPPLDRIVSALVDALIKLHGENSALKTVLICCPDAYTREAWQAEVEKILNDPKSKARSHDASATIYAALSALTDERELPELLPRIMEKWKLN
jgi:hypothetical protein